MDAAAQQRVFEAKVKQIYGELIFQNVMLMTQLDVLAAEKREPVEEEKK